MPRSANQSDQATESTDFWLVHVAWGLRKLHVICIRCQQVLTYYMAYDNLAIFSSIVAYFEKQRNVSEKRWGFLMSSKILVKLVKSVDYSSSFED